MVRMMTRRMGKQRPDQATQDFMRPVLLTGKHFWLLAGLAASMFAMYVYVFYLQYTQGHGAVTAQSTPVGAVWGLYVASIVFLIGVSHVGIGVSAATRLLNLEYWRPYARIAEMLTLVCLPAAVLMITVDIGKPEWFMFNVMRYGRITAPFVWSATVISVYFFASMVYLYLSMRRDIARTAELAPENRRWFYRLLALGYKDTEEESHLHDRVLWWMAVVLIPVMVSVHSVYGLVFGMQSARPGWFNPFMAPYFVLGALVNGFATLVIVAALLRWLFKWEPHMPVRSIRNMGRFLCWMTLLYIYFSVAEYITYIYSPLAGEAVVAGSLFAGTFKVIFWSAMVTLATGFLLLFFNQTVFHKQFSLRVTVIGAVLINATLFITRYLIVVPSLMRPLLPFPTGSYTPTVYEYATVIGVFGFAIGAYALFMKVFPIVELPHASEPKERE